MTTSPITTLTDELLAEIEAAAESATNASWDSCDIFCDLRYGCEAEEVRTFIEYASPANVHDLATQLRTLRAQNEGLAMNSDRYRELAEQANRNCLNLITYLAKHRPDLADEFRAYHGNIDTAMQAQK